MRGKLGRGIIWAAVAAIGLALGASSSAQAAIGDVGTPTVAPIPTTADSHPFMSVIDPQVLADNGYVEEEFSLTGDAFKYDTPDGADGSKKLTGPNPDGSYPYKTRVLVRRPANPADFNGRVLVEWLNVTATFDLDTSWGGSHDSDLMREGYAWVGVSAQRVGIDFLKSWFKDPTRYADLTAADGANSTDSDQASYDIYSQAAKAILGGGTGPDPMGTLDPGMLIASGGSQSGGRLNRYYDSIQNLHELIDSFLITVSNGTLREDLDAKVLRLLSERETLGGKNGEIDNDSYRRWEVAATSHVPEETGRYWEPLVARDFVPINFTCKEQPMASTKLGEVRQAALATLDTWQNRGIAPPMAPRMTYDGSDSVVRDQFGNARGGIALPSVTVPVETNTAVNEPAQGATDPFSIGFCRLLGNNLPFDDETLSGLYADHLDYLTRYRAAADKVLADGFITEEGHQRLIGRADDFPRLRPARTEREKVDGASGVKPKSSRYVLNWKGTTAPETTFDLQHKSVNGDWEEVKGGDALPDSSFKLQDETEEGTFTYRLNSTTLVTERSYRDSGSVTTDYSEPSAEYKIDRTGPRKPKVVLKGRRKGGKFVGKVRIKVMGQPDRRLADGSPGIGLREKAKKKVRIVKRRGSHRISFRSADLAGNRSKKKTVRFRIR